MFRKVIVFIAVVFVNPVSLAGNFVGKVPAVNHLIPIEGTNNFRDLGGYKTTDGKSIKSGMIFRSDALGDVTKKGRKQLEALDIKTIIDFRGPIEREKDPDVVLDSVRTYRTIMMKDGKHEQADYIRKLYSGEIDGPKARELLFEAYERNVREGGDALGVMFEDLADERSVPLVFHCTAGKDRAGFAAAVFLSLMGVPREDVVNDYLLTEYYREEELESRLYWMDWLMPDSGIEALRARLARPEYIIHVLELIDKEYGGIEQYARTEMGLSDTTIARLRQRFLD